MNLHELESTRLAIQCELEDALEESGGEVTPAVDAIADRLLAVEEKTAEKLDKYAYVIKSFEAESNRLFELEFLISQKRKAAEWTAERLKQRVLEYIEANVEPDSEGRKKVKGELHTLSLQKAGGRLPLVIAEDRTPEECPAWRKTKYEWDKDAIRSNLESGNKLPFAKLGERQTILRIR